MTNELRDAIVGMRETEALALAKEMLSNHAPEAVLAQAQEAMVVLGDRFEREEAFIPELMMGGAIMKAITNEVKPYITRGTGESDHSKGTIVIGTVAGDIHDIGKGIVTLLLDVEGYEVLDLGVDVPAEEFVEAIREHNPQVVGLSALLTDVFASMRATVEAITAAGLRDQVKIMVGGNPVDEPVCVYAGADGWGADVTAALKMAAAWTGGKVR